MELRFDRYADNDMLDARLHSLADEYPQLCTRAEIGQSTEGRPIWLITLTNSATGADTDKPAQWMDGNLHATEVTGTMACLHTIHHLLTGYGHDESITRLLDERVLYV